MAFLLAGVSVCDAGLAATPPEAPKSAHVPRGAASPVVRPEWEIIFTDGITTEEYAEQIDYFKIEIGAVSKNGKIEYISQVARRKPDKRVGNLATDYRLRIGWRQGSLHAADRRLLAKVGIASEGKELWHFLSTETQARMTALEHDYARREPRDIRRTRFEIRARTKGSGYEMTVVEQDPPKPTETKPPAKQSLNPSTRD
jgi:hypothetical protein